MNIPDQRSRGATYRLFYALWPDDDVRHQLTVLQESAGIDGKPVAAPNFHMTLAFLGNCKGEVLKGLVDLLAHLPETAFTLQLDRLGWFANPKVAWIAPDAPPAALGELRNELVRHLVSADIGGDHDRPFRPHVTLARDVRAPVRQVRPAKLVWQVREIALVHSSSVPGGVHYQVIASRWLRP